MNGAERKTTLKAVNEILVSVEQTERNTQILEELVGAVAALEWAVGLLLVEASKGYSGPLQNLRSELRSATAKFAANIGDRSIDNLRRKGGFEH